MAQDLSRFFFFFFKIALQLKQGLRSLSWTDVPANCLRKGILHRRGCDGHRRALAVEGAFGGGHGFASRELSHPGLKAESLCPNISTQAETI